MFIRNYSINKNSDILLFFFMLQLSLYVHTIFLGIPYNIHIIQYYNPQP